MGCLAALPASAQDRIHYTGTELANPAYHDGQLSPVVGVHNIQIMRANREFPDSSNGNGWTYNHQPMLAYWNGQFYYQYLCDPVDEHVPPSHTVLMTSKDGYHWTNPQIVFPEYKVPDGYTKAGRQDVAKNLIAIMHQRVGFYVSKSGKLITMGNYGVAMDKKDDPNDGNGIGRVVREIKKDGTYGPIYFIYYNHGFNEKNTAFPYFKRSKDKAFVKACQEILDNPLYRMQWVEEADRNDPIIPLNKEYKAFNYYTLPDGKIACLWKHALTAISEDGGNNWAEPVLRAKGFVNSNAKIWGQRLSDGTYATVYNPSEFRWPLAISLSKDGLEYTTLNLVHGEITPMRYGGNYKSYGPQYVRGIQEGNGTPKDGDLWVAYSVNKEDMWVSRIPVPVKLKAAAHADDDFSQFAELSQLTDWNIYSPVWAPVSLDKNWLLLQDKDPFDYAKIERKIPATKELKVAFDLQAGQNDKGTLQIEFLDENGIACSRLELTADGVFRAKGGSRFGNIMKYEAGKIYHVEALLSVANRSIQVFVDGKKAGTRMFYAPVAAIERIAFRTGELRQFPTPETPADQTYDLPNAGAQDALSTFRVANFKTSSTDVDATAAFLKYATFNHYADYFNNMEDENIAQAIPNSEASAWMEQNIPLFECPQKNFEEMYYYRWWSLRKHIKNTPAGYGMTEFLVNRSYADKYNLIACAIGHHIYESRWLRDPKYLDQIIHTWYRGNEGGPMKKMNKFSSWNADAIYNRFLVDGDKDFLLDMMTDLDTEYKRWESTNRLKNGLYWQGDVQDGMEESISGGRRKQYARPTINSYMYGNAKALSNMGLLAGNEGIAMKYALKADTLKQLVEGKLWNERHQFFETMRTDSSANVREAIGYIPWYFNLPDARKHDVAWKEVMDEKGFLAPYGMTTAERRHPEFRTRGVGKCEWDGAIWPFASAQTLTAMANFMNNYPQTVLTDSVYFRQMELYVESQYHRGRPYIGEYLDEVTGYWLKGDQERSRYYNHSTFNDLVITGLVGLRPRTDNTVEVNPLIPEGKWNWFCLDNVLYHGHNISIVWDKDGSRYHAGKGLRVYVNGKLVGQSDRLQRLVCKDVLN
ncbi:glycosyl hydrolase family 65 protein [Bacteroides graminisolvens]|uniref:MGH1-like glycoside hydrolase domain-containing protein n=1 Tax=Bacteroides graminisolvens TaxID=477666 RepID=UPI0023F00733|nr:glycosyl hydrolase family 65 protein [Bacteroides graminisolvens]